MLTSNIYYRHIWCIKNFTFPLFQKCYANGYVKSFQFYLNLCLFKLPSNIRGFTRYVNHETECFQWKLGKLSCIIFFYQKLCFWSAEILMEFRFLSPTHLFTDSMNAKWCVMNSICLDLEVWNSSLSFDFHPIIMW